MSDENANSGISTIINFIWTCPEKEAIPVLEKIRDYDSDTLVQLYVGLLNPARGMAKSVFGEEGIKDIYDSSKRKIAALSESSNVTEICTKYLLSCPSEELDPMLKIGFSQGSAIDFFFGLVIESRAMITKLFSEEDLHNMYFKNKLKYEKLTT